MVLRKLKRLFPSLVVWEPHLELDFDQYIWLEPEAGQRIGIKKAELSEKDIEILSTFLHRVHVEKRQLTDREELWYQILIENNQIVSQPHGLDSFRFVFFQIESNQIDEHLLEEGLKGIFSAPVPLLWFDSQSGILIEEFSTKDQEPVDFDEVIDVLMSDLYLKIQLFVGEQGDDLNQASAEFQWLKDAADYVFTHSVQRVSHLKESIPLLLVRQLQDEERVRLSNILLKGAKNDEELLRTIRIFLESNSNASEAAKKMYMHRNSLQYRIDKFIEITGIDIKSFEGAVTTYLVLKMLE
ncbi:PucR family transcriptional regulator [Salinibacillus xinjiangensis]|uniref:PucR C-terminal helix-turn-helix domain-containing protein n=1 Tax=Salinibacillus xinjiangensis TaxID=1229268 RepID=A0A6G1X1I7_9BACI|nr:helix-turn-helix domain-containing protein [Salinibacillus xinjiangensis]MRG84809.1 hypothetical protein [Salinibacillus xinjiangensis]